MKLDWDLLGVLRGELFSFPCLGLVTCEHYGHTSFYWASLYRTSQTLPFLHLKVCGNPALSKSIGAIFLSTFVHFMSLCHIWVILAVFQTFSLLLVMVICDQ